MSMNAYSGQHTNEMDTKGRVVLPSPFRKVPEEIFRAQLFLSPNPADTCIDVFPEPVWDAYIERIETDDSLEMGEADELIEDLYADAVQTKIDGQNRLVLSHELRKELKIDDIEGNASLVFVGAGSYFKVYTADVYEQIRADRRRRKLERMKKLKAGPNRRLNIKLGGDAAGEDGDGGE